ncbi:transcriptional regulator, TetR family [Parasphingorhabdus marina DSM 22363]|uniref:Transcriptional regulator, TetR family n=1 Tax=Parasphingorhabdus marina DSM 22363 TaxID=1123272 RepID=A0A1N6CYY8_9SPHN|nr:helix-turn-helix domain-containing protein [Parasphingorhabdus marina]SIN63676.1 transcriptional regulator, TetR family [Parasphingorhabdus marina DSM 22363]
MPTRFDHAEQATIREKLRAAAREAFARKGVARTTVDELAAAAHIGKGSFYKFYPTKQLLFFELLEDFQNDLRTPLILPSAEDWKPEREELILLLTEMFRKIAGEKLIHILGDAREFGAIIQKVPPERLLDHQTADQQFLDALIAKWSRSSPAPERDQIAAQMTLLILLCLRRDFVGERLFPHAARSLIRALADMFF